LLQSLQIGNVPDNILKDKKALREFFIKEFGINDDTVYESLGPKKMEIRSYMAIGILGRFQRLACVVCIDSEQSNQFVDFERLRTIPQVRLTSERGVAIIGKEDGELPEIGDLPGIPKELSSALTTIRKGIKDQEGWNEKKDFTKRAGLIISVAQSSQEIKIHAPAFLVILSWVLKQLRDTFMTEGV
jgi:hypothetical protein